MPGMSSCSRASSATSSRSVRVDSHKSIGHTDQLQSWISQRALSVIEAKSNAELRDTAGLCDRLQDSQRLLAGRADGLLDSAGLARERKRQVASDRWNRRIYEPLQARIESLVRTEGTSWTLDRARMHTEYLEVLNQRGFHPMDTYSPAGHCPEPRARPAVTAPPTYQPPRSVASRQQEERLLLRCCTGETYPVQAVGQMRLPVLPLVPLGRELQLLHSSGAWRGMRLGQIDSPQRQRSQRRMRPGSLYSQVEIA